MPTLSRAIALLTLLLCWPLRLAASEASPAAIVNGAATKSDANTTPDLHELETPDPPAVLKPDPAADKFWQALKLLKSSKPTDLAAGRIALQAAADFEFTHAQVLLGNCCISGSYGIAKDPRRGATLFRLAAERGNSFAMVTLGQCYLSGTGMRTDRVKAEQWLTSALASSADFSRPTPPPEYFKQDSAKEGKAEESAVAGALERDPVSDSQATAHFLLGQIKNQQKRPAEAQAHFVAAANAGAGGRDGIYLAALQAAINYAFGNGTARDLGKANEMLDQSRKLASRMGVSLIHNYVELKIVDEFATADLEESVAKAGETNETELQFKIAATFADKKSKDYNITEAVKWYEVAAENSQVGAMLSLAFIYTQGDLGKPNPALAFHWFEKAGSGDQPKHLLAAANLGICYQSGYGTAVDLAKAAEIFRKFKDQNFICYLGTLGQPPTIPQTFEQSMKLLQLWAKEKKDTQAQYFMGRRYLEGWDAPRNPETAVTWFKKAAKAEHAAAYCELGLIYENSPAMLSRDSTFQEAQREAVKCYKKSSELGNIDGSANYANMLVRGDGVARDVEKAEALNRQCLQIAPNHFRAHHNLAVICEEKLTAARAKHDSAAADEFRREMLEHYEKAFQLKFSYAARNLGNLYYDGKLITQDFRRAYSYYEKAAEWGMQGMQFKIGHMHEFGQGVPVTHAEAAYHYRLAALEGNVDATKILIDFYVEGKGVAQDLDRALYWISILARQRDPRTVTRLGDEYIRNRKYEIALKLFTALGEIDDVTIRGTADQRLSVLYSRGWGTEKDLPLAKKYRGKALKEGNLPAMHDTAMELLADGKKKAGIELLEKAVSRGLADSQFQLGSMYLHGDGVPKDARRAAKLFNDSADRGFADAQLALALLTLEKVPGAPDLETAIRLAKDAAVNGKSNATEVAEKLEHLRP